LNSKPVIILAGGFGTRLQGILKGLPKPLADINGAPFLKYLFNRLLTEGYNEFIISLYYESDQIIEYVEKLRNDILKYSKISYCVEPKPMGTGGAISYIVDQMDLKERFLVVNADTLLGEGYGFLGSFETDVIALVEVESTSRYGTVAIDPHDRITRFLEKKQSGEPGLINAGVYNLSAQIFKDRNGIVCSLELDIFPKLISGKKLKGIKFQTSFIDIGVPDDYNKFCSENKSQ
jgi:D-glycero-alpha-D-manno-heptose 1-phosphate guanylyltransferase